MAPEHLTGQFIVSEVNQVSGQIDNNAGDNYSPRTFNDSSIVFSLYWSKRTNCWNWHCLLNRSIPESETMGHRFFELQMVCTHSCFMASFRPRISKQWSGQACFTWLQGSYNLRSSANHELMEWFCPFLQLGWCYCWDYILFKIF